MNNINLIRSLVGEISLDQLRYVDCYVIDNFGIFIPSVGCCYYAITPQHTHPAYSFIYNFDNNGAVKIDNRTICYEHASGTVFSPEVPHQEIPAERLAHYISIFVEKNLFEEQYAYYNSEPAPCFRAKKFSPLPDLLPELKTFMCEYENKLPGHPVILKSSAMKVIHALIRSLLQITPSSYKNYNRVEINKVIEFLHSHYAEKISVGDMAKRVYLSPSHFSRVFKDETGDAPIEYLNRLRLEKACKLLRAGDKQITEIALECGFNSSAYFSNVFYHQYQISPSDYKKNLNQTLHSAE